MSDETTEVIRELYAAAHDAEVGEIAVTCGDARGGEAAWARVGGARHGRALPPRRAEGATTAEALANVRALVIAEANDRLSTLQGGGREVENQLGALANALRRAAPPAAETPRLWPPAGRDGT